MGVESGAFTEVPCLYDHTQICDSCRLKSVSGRQIRRLAFDLRRYDIFDRDGFDSHAKDFFGVLCSMIFNPDGWHPSVVEGQFLKLNPIQKLFIVHITQNRKSWIDKNDSACQCQFHRLVYLSRAKDL